MFTGIVTALGDIAEVKRPNDRQDMRAIIRAPESFLAAYGGTKIGASIACSGCCLTATDLGADWFAVDVSAETVSHTTLSDWQPGTRINLERSLRVGDELGGHLVSGHIDGVGRIDSITSSQGSLRFRISLPPPLHRFIAQKGSVAVDGISLTVNEVDGASFGVNIIPHTAANTTLGMRAPGDAVQIEIDMLARYVARLRDTA